MRLDGRWRRALAWFACCLAVSGASGVLADLGDLEAAVLPTLGALAVVVVAYGVVWPIGTYTLDRPRDPVSTWFGVAWGVLGFKGATHDKVAKYRVNSSRPESSVHSRFRRSRTRATCAR